MRLLCRCRLCGQEFNVPAARHQFDRIFNWSGKRVVLELVSAHLGCPKGIGVGDVLGLVDIEEERDDKD